MATKDIDDQWKEAKGKNTITRKNKIIKTLTTTENRCKILEEELEEEHIQE